MRHLMRIAVFLILIPVSVWAQETPKIEVFGGYSFVRPEGGGNFNGWQASVAGNVNDWFGVVAEFSGHYDSRTRRLDGLPGIPGEPVFSARSETDSSLHTFLFGPRFSYRKHERITPFAHALIGAGRRHDEGTTTISVPGMVDRVFDSSFTDTHFAAALGGGIDLKLNRRIALRMFQVDYLPVRNDAFTMDNVRISTGLVFRF